ncbi:hypothetical protein ABZ508_09675 [Streptomyces lavendulocolor]|uniref:Uncharacterized protein n=1 Tax=Streptomyces lavendulocolor TaxID=67316 RepID=A0ABV2W269_9ACTN
MSARKAAHALLVGACVDPAVQQQARAPPLLVLKSRTPSSEPGERRQVALMGRGQARDVVIDSREE